MSKDNKKFKMVLYNKLYDLKNLMLRCDQIVSFNKKDDPFFRTKGEMGDENRRPAE